MLKPDLTLMEASSRLVNPRQVLFWEINKQDAFLKSYKELRDLIDRAIKDGFATLVPDIIGFTIKFDDSATGQSANQEYKRLLDLLEQLFGGKFAELLRKWSRILGAGLLHQHSRLNDLIYEFALNAIEHGSNYCEMGIVTLEVQLGVGEALCTITQPGPVPNLKEMGLESIDPLGFLSENKKGRGAGMFNAAWDFTPMIGFESIEPSGGRTIILETHERVLGIDLKMRRGSETSNSM